MTRFRVLIIVMASFGVGFVSRDYIGHAMVRVDVPAQALHFDNHASQVVETTTRGPSSEANEEVNPVSASVAYSSQMPVTLDHIVRQMNNANYMEAVHLLKTYLETHQSSPQAWSLLAQAYQKLMQPQAALDAWFHYLNFENDATKIERALRDIKNYLSELSRKAGLFNNDLTWLVFQYDELIRRTPNDGDTHLALAELYLQQNDSYQAQYHALMAANDPNVQVRAQAFLAKLNKSELNEEIAIPLIHIGNQYIVNAQVEGNPVRLLVDTGASISGLMSGYTQKVPTLVKNKKPISINSAGGVYNTVLFTVDSIAIGSLVFNQQILALLNMNASQDFEGLLGVDILGRFDFVIDQDASLLKLKQRK